MNNVGIKAYIGGTNTYLFKFKNKNDERLYKLG